MFQHQSFNKILKLKINIIRNKNLLKQEITQYSNTPLQNVHVWVAFVKIFASFEAITNETLRA